MKRKNVAEKSSALRIKIKR